MHHSNKSNEPPEIIESILSTEDSNPEEINLRRAKVLAKLLDAQFQLPGSRIRFGIDPLLGLLPVGGDLISSSLALYIPYLAYIHGVSMGKIMQMLSNLLIDTVCGAVPLLGDIFDLSFKANQRNLVLLEEEFQKVRSRSGRQRTRSKALAIIVGLICFGVPGSLLLFAAILLAMILSLW